MAKEYNKFQRSRFYDVLATVRAFRFPHGMEARVYVEGAPQTDAQAMAKLDRMDGTPFIHGGADVIELAWRGFIVSIWLHHNDAHQTASRKKLTRQIHQMIQEQIDGWDLTMACAMEGR